MPLYSYTGKNTKSEPVQGSIDSEDIPSAKQALSAKGIFAEEVFQISYDSTVGPESITPQQASAPSEEKQVPPLEEDKEPVLPQKPKKAAAVKKQAKAKESTTSMPKAEKEYYPISDTLRLYAGWLLAWYGLVYALGSYQSTRELSFEIPYLMGIYYSPLVLSFTLGSFLFLLLSGLHRIVGRGILPGLFFSIVGLGLFGVYRMNV